jgi:hypothetical protein
MLRRTVGVSTSGAGGQVAAAGRPVRTGRLTPHTDKCPGGEPAVLPSRQGSAASVEAVLGLDGGCSSAAGTWRQQ